MTRECVRTECVLLRPLSAARLFDRLDAAELAIVARAVAFAEEAGLERGALGHHYASDVLFGALLGAAVGVPVAVVAF